MRATSPKYLSVCRHNTHTHQRTVGSRWVVCTASWLPAQPLPHSPLAPFTAAAHPAVCRRPPRRHHCIRDPPGSNLQLSALSLTPLAAVDHHLPPLSPSPSTLIHRRRRRHSPLPLTSAANHRRRRARCPPNLLWRATSSSHHLHRTSLRY